MNKGIILIDADDTSITVTWCEIGKPSSSHPTKYTLQYRPATSANDNGIDSGGQLTYQSLSTELTTNTARKRNLTGAGHGFFFRVSATTKSQNRVDKSAMDYMGHAHRRPFTVLTMMEQSQRMPPPVAKIDSSVASSQPNSYVAHISWQASAEPLLVGYKLQMRESNGTSSWSTVANCLSGTEVRKKNLTSSSGYMFRVRPVLQGETGGSEENLVASVNEGGNVIPYSSASDVVGARSSSKSSSSSSSGSEGLLRLFKRLPDNKLLAKGGMKSVSLTEAFNKVDLVFFYASAHWCGPCRRFTPQLIKFYNDAKAMYAKAPGRTTKIEVVFISADHDVNGFRSYYASMPWLAVPFDADTREILLSWMKVKGIPQLMCLDGRTGKVYETNGVGRALDLARFSRYIGRDKSSIR
uniref:protein-disulfide reductase n=1 Tax=Skeletonema marinoi TaxID=267567 RepID=A0A7S2M0V1_9STRA|mmetsp:Transcript_33025/g.55988  ORF Transcript_33025/g.55988 Transcript_33025/m.55988 type:complete len:411 (+) Transcript_33025:107-1339(+)